MNNQDEAAADSLFEMEPEQEEAGSELRLLVHFRTIADRRAFSRLVGQRIDGGTKFISYPIANKIQPDFLPGTEDVQVKQSDLLSIDENWRNTWQGMPSFSHQDLEAYHTILVYFSTQTDRRDFARLIEHPVSDETKFVWFPRAEVDKVIGLQWRSTCPQNPRYPVYVPTKGRWDSAYTIRCLERLQVPYYAVVQPQERLYYEPVVKTGVMLLLPAGLDGLVPTRNWIFEHATASGAERHWQLDDNIKAFYRYHENRQIRTADGTCMRIAEDFADRYENIAIAGFQYFMFIPRKKDNFPPYVFNTRVYSNSLINNSMSFRYRDVYNDDTDICLRALKAGWCTVQFNAFNAYKMPTMQVKGGNTPLYLGATAVAAEWEAHATTCMSCKVDESPNNCKEGRAILSKDGRWLMAESLRRQHPDVAIVGRRFHRWQHYVDYRRFRTNVPILKTGVIIPEGSNEYGLELVAVEDVTDQDERLTAKAQHNTPSSSGPSALDFIRRLIEREPTAEGPAQQEPKKPERPASAAGEPGHGKALGRPSEPATAGPQLEFGSSAGRFGCPEPEPEPSGRSATELKLYLEARGHQLFTIGEKFFVSEASRLTDADRAQIKQHRAALIALSRSLRSVEKVPSSMASAASLFEEPKVGQTIAQFLGSEPQHVNLDWKPDEPPDLTGIDEIVLNFATDGLDWAHGNKPVGLTVSTLDGLLTRFLPFGFRGGNLDENAVKRWYKEQIRGKRITNANTRFEVHMSREWGIDLEEQGCTVSDVMHYAALLDDHRKRFSLDVLAADYLPGEPMVERVDERDHATYAAAEVAARELYTARTTAKLRNVMWPLLEDEDLHRVRQLEDDVIYPVCEMEKNGSPIDLGLLEEYHAECTRRHDALMWEVSKELGFAFEHTASGWKRLLEHFSLEVPDSFAEDVLNLYDHPTVQKAQQAARYASLNSKTFAAYKKIVGSDGILRYDINQLRGDDGGTVSGRFSIGYVQQVPNYDNHFAAFGEDLFPRRLFVAAEGDYLESDAMQIEYRLFAHFAGNQKILEAYREDPTLSFHKMTWEMMKRYKPNMLYVHQKSFNFAKQYGAKSIKLAVMMGFITAAEGEEIREAKRWNDPRLRLIHEIEAAYKRMMPESDMLLDRASHLAKSKCDNYCKANDALHRQYKHRGYVKTLLGRRSRFPHNYKTYIGLNRVLQGTGADVMKKKIVELHRERKTTGFVMRLTNHDAVLGDARLPETKDRVSEILNAQSFSELKVPILWSAGTGRSWADCK